ncbi:shikimate kinase [Candidatus Omnitrophota bacterium]
MKNIYLVGFMATGKTSVGRALAKKLNKDFFDLDDLIEQRENMRIVDIFNDKGEPYFRRIESQIIKEVSGKSDLVIGCGGGAIVNEENLATLKEGGIVICLKAKIDTILDRSKGTEQRPLLNVEDPKNRIRELLDKREPFYNQSDHIIDTAGLDINAVVDKIITIVDSESKEP